MFLFTGRVYSFFHALSGHVFCPCRCGKENMIRSGKNTRLAITGECVAARPSDVFFFFLMDFRRLMQRGVDVCLYVY